MLLGFDVGNTNIVLGVFEDGRLVQHWRMQTDYDKSADEYGMTVKQLFEHSGIDMDSIDDVIISTVVPRVLFTLQHLSLKYFGKTPIVVESGIKTGLIIKYDNPKQVGADRIVNAVAAHAKYPGPLIIIDFGTATTFCAVTDDGQYLGGTIAPGMKISLDALVERTAQLPNVELEAPGHTICKNTEDSIKSGLVYGHMGLIEHIIYRMKNELTEICGTPKVTVVATGGLATMIQEGVTSIDHVDKLLTLEGLQLIYEKNKNR